LANRLIWGSLFQGACAFLVLLIADLESLVYGGPRIMRLEWAAGLAVLIALAFVVLGQERDLRRNFASLDQYTEYSQAVRTEDMPTNIEPDVWRRRLKTNRRSNLLRLLCACFLVGVGLASLLTDQSVYRWMTASLFQLVAIWFLVKWWDTREALAALAAQVERHANRQSWG
jgi:protein-S-isoprenylcysteine O-methyltransferase Ste14